MDANQSNQPVNYPEVPTQPIQHSVNNKKGNLPIIFGVIFLLLIVGGGAYYLGTQNSKTIPQNSQKISQVNPTMAPKEQATGIFVKYQHKMFHLGYPVFETEVPNTWTAYTTYEKIIYQDPATIYLGEAQNKNSDLLNDIIPSVTIRIAKNKKLSEIDPKQWPQNDQLSMFFSSPISGDWTMAKVGDLNAKKTNVETAGSPKDVVYFTKDGVIFTISNDGADQSTFDHILSTFKIINLQYL